MNAWMPCDVLDAISRSETASGSLAESTNVAVTTWPLPGGPAPFPKFTPKSNDEPAPPATDGSASSVYAVFTVSVELIATPVNPSVRLK